eukprot:CAMPEP_0174835066 /NCGR_PEP_ID=MMETSP1114-20130205/5219_1 /TAXON_ID=312471 /ORGANISM="Neobodo designis, Strain CCAP 1951/1" /LENGTH=33 /DNA_ID= /DNA_START= /DNA_END= /DNA_ORIENTATION=
MENVAVAMGLSNETERGQRNRFSDCEADIPMEK